MTLPIRTASFHVEQGKLITPLPLGEGWVRVSGFAMTSALTRLAPLADLSQRER
jgi:hypothetical protein